MTLKSTFAGGLSSALSTAHAAGLAWVVSNTAAISALMVTASASGKKTFTVTLPTSFQPADLRLLGPLWFAYQTGVQQGLAVEEIYNSEVTVNLNTADQVTTSIDLVFTF